MKNKLIYGLIALLVIWGCGGAGAPYVPDFGNTTGGNFTVLGTGTQTVTQGQTATFNLQIMLGQQVYQADRSPTPVSLTVEGTPANSTESFSENPVVPTDPATDVTLTVVTQATTPPGTYNLTVTGDDGQLRQSTTFTLIVNPVQTDFGIAIETRDGNMTNQPPFDVKPKRGLLPDDPTAQYYVTVVPPTGYAGQVRVEYRFVDNGAPTNQDISAEFSQPGASNMESFTFTIAAGVAPERTECVLRRLRFPIPVGAFGIEFKVVPLVGGFNSAAQNAQLEVIENGTMGGRRFGG